MLRLARGPTIFVLTATQVEVSIGSGRRSETMRLDVDLAEDGASWAPQVPRLADGLRPLVEMRRLAGSRAIVLYENPTSVVRLTSLAAMSERQMRSAARLAALGTIGACESTALADAREIARDGPTAPPRRHLLSVADRNDSLDAVDELIESLGMTAEHILPLEALITTHLFSKAMGNGGATHGHFYIGAEQSWLIVTGERTLQLFRPIGFGLQQLTDVLTRPICLTGSRAEFTLTPDRAAAMLAEHGIPDREQVLDATCDLKGQHIMPLLQPVLQRMIVEVKQSLRFGLTIRQRQDLGLTLCGPGASIRGLATIIGDAVEAPVRVETAPARAQAAACHAVGGLDRATIIETLKCCPNLIPPRVVGVHAVRQFNRAAWAGLAVAGALLFTDAQRLDGLIDRQQARLSAISDRIDEAARADQIYANMKAREAEYVRVRNSFTAATAFAPDLAALLREIARHLGPEVRLIRLECSAGALESIFSGAAQPSTLRLEGYAFGSESEAQIASLAESLVASPLVTSATLSSMVRSEIDGRPARRFELRLIPASAGRAARSMLVEAGKGGER